MRCACIDIGSNTTRVLVADVEDGRLDEVIVHKTFTRLGRELRRTGSLPAHVIETVAEVVAAQKATAEAAGAERVRVVATAAIRLAVNGPELCAAVRERAGTPVSVLTGEEEAQLAFTGAVRTLRRPLDGRVAVVDVGGGSSEIAVGTAAGGADWAVSVAIGSGTLAEHCLGSDPPAAEELRELAELAAGAFTGIHVPAVDHAIAVGGSATSTARLVGPYIAPDGVDAATRILCAMPAEDVARRHGLDPERVRLLPAGLHLLGAAARVLGRPLEVGRGGLREGACLLLARVP
jgi:exopolyphosphatase / guanosine-5'-triphosphate,3'-diphosphate pyrophosphatase